MHDRQIILIGGAPTSGKSFLAKALSKSMDLPYMSTDQIRTILKSVADKNKYPALFNASNYDAERFLTELSAEQIVTMEFSQGEETWIGVRALIENHASQWTRGYIIEGVGILPNMVFSDYKNDPTIKPLFLVDRDDARTREVIFKRGLWDNADNYRDSLKEKEIEWVALYNARLEADAQRYGYALIDIHKDKDDIHKVIAAIS